MLSEGEETRSQRQGLGKRGERTEFVHDSLPKQILRQLRRRWKMLGSIVVTSITTAAIYRVDESFSLDVIAFVLLTLALLLYTILTIRNDVHLD